MPDQLFELFIVHPALARLGGVRELRIDIVQRERRRTHHDDGGIAAFARHVRLVQLARHIFFDALGLALVRLDLLHKLVVQGEDAEVQAVHLRAVVRGEIADLHARAADVEQHGALVGAVKAVGDVVAVGLRLPVHRVDGQPRAVEDGGADLFKVADRAQRRRRDEVDDVHPEAEALVLHQRDRLDQLVDAPLRQVAPVQIVQQRQAGTVAENDLGDAVVGVRHHHRNAAGTDIDHRIFHTMSSCGESPPAPGGTVQRPRQMPMPSAAATISAAGSTSL